MMLTHLVLNTPAQILSIDADPVIKLNLMELGFVPGTQVEFVSSTPFGDPEKNLILKAITSSHLHGTKKRVT